MSTGTTSEQQTFADALDPETLSALMRSTWTWDDRALRRDLGALLVQVAAANGTIADPAVAAAVRATALRTGAQFVATVLGPHLVADLGSPFRAQLHAAAASPTTFDRMVDAARAEIRPRATEYLRSCGTEELPDESSWLTEATAGPRELGAVMRAFGRSDSAAPLRGNIGLALQTLRTLGASGADLASRIERGETRCTLAAAEQTGSWDPAMVRARAVPETAGWKLTGAKYFVPDAAGADVILVVARSVAGPSVFAVDADAPGLRITRLDSLDPGRPLFTVELHDTPATLLGREGQGGLTMRRSIDLAMTALAGEQVGLLERAIAVLAQHADAAWPGDELVLTVLDHAAAVSLWRSAVEPDAGAGAAAMAHIGCSDASLRAARLAAEVAGDDETAGLLRRALSASLLLGGPAVHYERLLERLDI